MLTRGDGEYDARDGGGIGRFGCHESRKSQSLQTDLMDFLRLAVKGRMAYNTRAPAATEAFQQRNSGLQQQQRAVLLSMPLCNSAAHYYYLVYLWLSFIPSLPRALWKANNYNTLKELYKHRALKKWIILICTSASLHTIISTKVPSGIKVISLLGILNLYLAQVYF